ncbi:MAG: OmpA family protein [Pseudomonadota bacterium]
MRYFLKPSAIALSAALALGACVTDPETGERRISKTALGGIGGALGGYLLGDVIGGRNDRTEKLAGAGLGALAGAGIGAYMDRQERELRERTRGTDVSVIRQGDDLVLRMPAGITFDYDRADILPQFKPTLDQVAAVLSENPQTLIDVYGHTDATGSDAYNQGLSERRAAQVANYLAFRQVDSRRVATRGFGESQPIADNATANGQATNRRVEIKIAPLTEG